MRNRRDVADGAHFDAGGSEGADSGLAARTGTGYAHIDLQVSYLRHVHGHAGRLSARGWVTKPGRRVAFAQGEVLDPAGKLLATATASLAVMTAPAA